MTYPSNLDITEQSATIGLVGQLATCPAHGGGEEVLVSWSKGRTCNSRIS